MKPQITVQRLDKIGDREDFLVRAVGPGETDYSFPLSISGTAVAIWESEPDESAKFLANELLAVSGTAKVPPREGFWFDSFNSGDSLKETSNKIRNFGIEPFIKNRTASDNYRNLLGDELFSKIDQLNNDFTFKFSREFITALDCAFEFSQVKEHLNNPPKDLANFLIRICILSGIIDHLNVRLPEEKKNTPTLIAFKNWLAIKIGSTQAEVILKPFLMVKYLRKQYPIHDNYRITEKGVRIEREEISQAKQFFNTSEDFAESWHNVLTKFGGVLDEIITIVQSM